MKESLLNVSLLDESLHKNPLEVLPECTKIHISSNSVFTNTNWLSRGSACLPQSITPLVEWQQICDSCLRFMFSVADDLLVLLQNKKCRKMWSIVNFCACICQTDNKELHNNLLKTQTPFLLSPFIHPVSCYQVMSVRLFLLYTQSPWECM